MVEIMLCISLNQGTIYKMFGLHHFQALKNNWSVGQHIFFFTFFISLLFLYQAQWEEKQKEVSGDLFCDLGP